MIAVNQPLVGPRELEYLAECVQSGWISSEGKFVAAFEERWAEFCGRRYGVAVSSGTAALHVAVACLKLQPGDEVILPAFTIISSALAVIANGGVPVLVDADPRTWCLNVHQIESRITPRTRAIMPVHIYGHPVEMDPLLVLADRHGLAVIEDAAEAHGAEYRSARYDAGPWRRCGSFGTASCFSFYANKVITTGEGGMILTDDPTLAEKARSLRNLCFGTRHRFFHEDLGYNFRLTNLQAAVGVAQIERAEAIVSRKRAIGHEYTRRLGGIRGLQLPAEEPWARSVYWMYGVLLADAITMDAHEFGEKLNALGVETRPFFLGMHEQPVFRARGLFEGESHPVAERLARRGLYLPSGVGLTDEQLVEVCDAARQVLS